MSWNQNVIRKGIGWEYETTRRLIVFHRDGSEIPLSMHPDDPAVRV